MRQLAAQQHALGPHGLQAAKKGSPPCAHRENSSEKDDRVDTEATRTGPVGIRFQIEPQREFIEGQSGPNSIADRHEAAEKN